MKFKTILLMGLAILFAIFKSSARDFNRKNLVRFNVEKDLLLIQFDCKTDVDDIQTVAALATLLTDSNYININYHAVAGTYGIQEGLYVPANSLFQVAFGDNWSDAHNDILSALEQVAKKVKSTLLGNGDIWIAEAGQSDFTAKLIKLIQVDLPEIDITKRIHIVQHGAWNEKNTSPENLDFIKKKADYYKIPDGNAVGNGTPGFRDPEFTNWKDQISNKELIEIWELATEIANKYNGQEGRYKNEAIFVGGLDFSDLSAVCWILGLENIKDSRHFFELYVD